MKRQTLPEERRAEICDILSLEGKLTVPDLSKRLNVSIDTIRRDLIELETAGHLSRVHGGALPKSPAARPYSIRKKELTPGVHTIARGVAKLVHSGQTFFLDSGTTAVEIARSLPGTLKATVVTPSPPVAMALAEHRQIEVIMLPGILDRETMAVVGGSTLKALKQIRADICIIGVCGIHSDVGITTVHYEESVIKKQMIMNSSETIVAVTANKLGTAVSFEAAGIDCIDRLVTEASITDEELLPYRQAGIDILKVV